MAQVRYDHRKGPGKGIEVPCAHSYFHRLGGGFVTIVSGNATLTTQGDPVAGWVNAGRDANSGLKDSVLVSAGKVFVITGLDDHFEIPVNEASASLALTHVGQGADIIVANESTYLTKQYAKLGAAASPLVVTHVDVTNKTVHVRIKPAAYQPL